MALLNKLKRKSGAARRFDPCLGDARLTHVVQSLSHGVWQPADDIMRRPDLAWLAATVLTSAEAAVPLSSFERWAEERPSALSLAMLGRAQIRAAWQIRGRYTAEYVEKDAWAGFYAGLETAEATLMGSIERDPNSAEPWVGLISTGRGLQHGIKEIGRRFDEAHMREPFRPDACAAMLQGLCDKWGGSHEDMFQFARWIETNAKADSPAKGLLHLAHFEYVLAEDRITSEDHFSDPDVNTEVVASAEKYLANTPSQAEAQHLEPLNLFMLSVTPMDRRSAGVLTETIRRVDNRPTVTPWSYYGDSIPGRFEEFRIYGIEAASRF